MNTNKEAEPRYQFCRGSRVLVSWPHTRYVGEIGTVLSREGNRNYRVQLDAETSPLAFGDWELTAA